MREGGESRVRGEQSEGGRRESRVREGGESRVRGGKEERVNKIWRLLTEQTLTGRCLGVLLTGKTAHQAPPTPIPPVNRETLY